MRLIALKLEGFKSFADSVHLAFAGGLTGVVGPNGSGNARAPADWRAVEK